ncbi:hypothetical protein AVEN_88937-1 [Araneus ventricosus]|uniref:Uncharacterized protein n=1 Tax=Araneus ventricosus TaxID=182803 RepID=A0A4Y2KND2_ARAVE|nr:hypothetical protein AVEN_88937-1 [Araneus ventricosus]
MHQTVEGHNLFCHHPRGPYSLFWRTPILRLHLAYRLPKSRSCLPPAEIPVSQRGAARGRRSEERRLSVTLSCCRRPSLSRSGNAKREKVRMVYDVASEFSPKIWRNMSN